MKCVERIALLMVELANRATTTSCSQGYFEDHVGGRLNFLCKVYLVPYLKLNLLSCSRLDDFGITTTVARGKCKLPDWKGTREFGNRIQRSGYGPFIARVVSPTQKAKMKVTKSEREHPDLNPGSMAKDLWYRRLAHSDTSVIKDMSRGGKNGMNYMDECHLKNVTYVREWSKCGHHRKQN